MQDRVEALKCYYDSGTYHKQINSIARSAINHLKSYINKKEEIGIVLDIDETAVSNYPIELKMKFLYDAEAFAKFIKTKKETIIKATLDLFNQAKKQSAKIFFISARPESQRDFTEKNLIRLGYFDWTELILKPENYGKQKSAAEFKTSARARIAQTGLKIILNVGDQYSDLYGGFSERIYKYPNPFYFIK